MKKKKQKHVRTVHKFAPEVVDTKDFAGKIIKNRKTGMNELKINSLPFYQHQLNKFKVGESVSLYISSRRPKRTIQQNRYYWLYLGTISKETGEEDVERLHSLFTGKFLTSSIEIVLGQQVRMKRSTTELSKADFSEYMEKIQAETGIPPPPIDNYFPHE